MCTAKTPKPQPLPPARALARTPQRIIPPEPTNSGAQSTRQTVVNPNPANIMRAATARLGGGGVVLGGSTQTGGGNGR